MKTKFKKVILFVNFSFISIAITTFFAHSYFNSNNFSTHELLNSKFHEFLYSSHLNDQHSSHDTNKDTNEDHEHKHRHSENEEEHSHKHLSFISSSEIVIYDYAYKLFLLIKKHSVAYLDYNIRFYDSFTLEILKPPIYA